MNTLKVIRITKVLLEKDVPEPIINMIIQKVFEDQLVCPGCDKTLHEYWYDKKCNVCDKCLYCKILKDADWSGRVCEDCCIVKGWGVCGRCDVLFNKKLGKRCWCGM